MAKAGISITITSLTSFVAFAFGMTSSLPALSSFSLSASFGILFAFFNQLTFFSVFVYYDIKRIEKNYSDWCGCLCCKERSVVCCKGKLSLNDDGQLKKSSFQTFLAEKFIPLITKSPNNIIVIILFLILTIASALCAT